MKDIEPILLFQFHVLIIKKLQTATKMLYLHVTLIKHG